jgi:hypothetical protein
VKLQGELVCLGDAEATPSRNGRDLQRAIVRLRSSRLIRKDRDEEVLEITYGDWLTEMSRSVTTSGRSISAPQKECQQPNFGMCGQRPAMS